MVTLPCPGPPLTLHAVPWDQRRGALPGQLLRQRLLLQETSLPIVELT